MEEIKRKLMESGVIGRVLDDFNPCLKLILGYRYTQINLGDEVTLAEVQRHPTYHDYQSDPLDVELQQTLDNPELVELLVMTDPDAPGGEYLHWLTMSFVATEDDRVLNSPPMELVAYEPPRSGAHVLVLTLFKARKFQSIAVPDWRENFSTRSFAHTHALGSPLGASFFKIKYENENEKQDNEGSESSTGINRLISAGSYRKRQENGLISNPKEIPESTSTRTRNSVSLGHAFSSFKYENEGENRKKD